MKYNIRKEIVTVEGIIGYEVIDLDTKEIRRLKYNDAIKLAKRKQIDGIVVSDLNGIEHFKPDKIGESLSEENNKYTILFRVLKGEKLVGYICESDVTKQQANMTPVQVWELAANNRIKNARAKLVNNQIALVGDPLSLDTIPIKRIN